MIDTLFESFGLAVALAASAFGLGVLVEEHRGAPCLQRAGVAVLVLLSINAGLDAVMALQSVERGVPVKGVILSAALAVVWFYRLRALHAQRRQAKKGKDSHD